MNKKTLLLLILCVLLVTPAMAGRITSTKITHLEQIYQAYAGSSEGNNPCFEGYAGTSGDVISSTPGILCIVPGEDWANFVGAAQEDPPVDYTIKNTTLVKTCPEYVQCASMFPEVRVTQQGTPNIRLWWPLMYEVPSCEFTLTILYGTPVLYDDDGPLGPNPPAWVHVEEWVWHVDATLDSLSLLLELFHEIPFGKDEVPLISDEPLYDALQDKISAANDAYQLGDTGTAALILADFELEVMDACIDVSPEYPNPTGPGTGIANTDENPACCKLLIDVEYILLTTGIGQPTK